MLKGLDTSSIKYDLHLAPVAISAGACTTAVDYSNFTHGTLLVSTGSTGAAAVTADVLRSSTSGGTFHNFGASINSPVADTLHARSFTMGSSDVFYKVYYTQLGSGSPAVGIVLKAAGTREAPVDQHASTTSYSVINSA